MEGTPGIPMDRIPTEERGGAGPDPRTRVAIDLEEGVMAAMDEQEREARKRHTMLTSILLIGTIIAMATLGVGLWSKLADEAIRTIQGRNTPNCPRELCARFWEGLEGADIPVESLADEVQVTEDMGCACWTHPHYTNDTTDRKPMLLAVARMSRWKRGAKRTRTAWAERQVEMRTRTARERAESLPRLCRLGWRITKPEGPPESVVSCNREEKGRGNPNLCLLIGGAEWRLCTQITWHEGSWEATAGGRFRRTEEVEESTAIGQEYAAWQARVGRYAPKAAISSPRREPEMNPQGRAVRRPTGDPQRGTRDTRNKDGTERRNE